MTDGERMVFMKLFPTQFDESLEDDEGVRPDHNKGYFVKAPNGVVHVMRFRGMTNDDEEGAAKYARRVEYMTIGDQCLWYCRWQWLMRWQQKAPTCLSCIVAMEGM